MPSERLLLRDGEPVALTPKAFDILVALVTRAGRLADKEELLKEVWPDAFVEESNLTQAIFAIRRALAQAEGDKPYIETVPKRGYRFTAPVRIVDDTQPAPSAPTDPPASLTPPPTANGRGRYAIALVGLVALAVVAALLFKSWRASDAPPAFQKMEMERLTTSGNIFNVAVSPDGKYVAHAVRDKSRQSLWVRQTATASVVQIVAPSNVSFVGLTFSPDSSYIYYTLSRPGVARRTLHRVPVLGGTPMQLNDNLRGGSAAVSPDGRQLAFIRVTAGRESVLIIANADGSGERTLLSRTTETLDAPAWSPDGKRIAFAAVNPQSNDSAVFEADVAGGDPRPITSRRWLRIIKLAWTREGGSLLLLATPGESFTYQIWQLSYPGGAVTRVTNDLINYGSMSLAADAGMIAAVAADTQANIWVAPDNDASRIRPVTTGAGRIDAPTDWTADGRIVYHSNVNGAYDIWIVAANGGTPQQLTRNMRINQGPVVSPDGSYILFLSDRTGTPHLWRMNLDGSSPRQITFGPQGEQNARFSPDGKWITYRTSSGRATTWRMPSGGGEAVQIADKTSYPGGFSPDGRLVGYLYQDEGAPLRIAIAPSGGGAPIATFAFAASPPVQRLIRWTPDGRAIAFIDTVDDASNIFAQPIDGGPPVQLTSFKEGRIFAFAWSRDGRQLAVSRGTLSSDVVVIRNVR
jgi:Tol biopolymer transport system component/DNA-binding winged helix-turn-helix (wHTH) protein